MPSSSSNRRVVVLATGGTIAGESEHASDASYRAGALPIDALLDAVPELSELADVYGEQIASIGSQDMHDALWLRIAARVNTLIAMDDIDGIVITHGTDTMEETAYFLNLVVASDKPVVLTGSMRPATGLSADGPLNLYHAVAVATHPDARDRGVLIVMNDVIHAAREVVKTHTLSVQTFESVNRGPLGALHHGDIRFFRRPGHRHTHRSAFAGSLPDPMPRVDVLYAHANMRGDLVDAAIGLGAEGIVIAGVGNGNMMSAARDALALAAEQGAVVVRSTRTEGGAVLRNVEIDDDALGFVASDGLSPQKARILLKLALTRTRDAAAIQELFHNY